MRLVLTVCAPPARAEPALRALLESWAPGADRAVILFRTGTSTDAECAGLEASPQDARWQRVDVSDGAPLRGSAVHVLPTDSAFELRRGRFARRSGTGGPSTLLASLGRERGEGVCALALRGTHELLREDLRDLRTAGGVALLERDEGAPDGSEENPGPVQLDLAQVPALLDGLLAGLPAAEELAAVAAALRESTGFDARAYGDPPLRRAVLLHRARGARRDAQSHLALLRERPEEALRLVRDLRLASSAALAGSEELEALVTEGLSASAERAEAGTTLRAWVPGCGAGAEAYAVAAQLLEAVEALPASDLSVEVLATEFDERVLVAARAGRCGPELADRLSPALLARHFSALPGGGYEATEALRAVTRFAAHDLSTDPLPSGFHLLVARSVLRDLERAAQRDALRKLHGALLPAGLLLLGGAQTTGAAPGLFSLHSKPWRIYRKRAGERAPRAPRAPLARVSPEAQDPSALRLRDAVLHARTPPSIVVAEDGVIAYAHGDLSPYLLRFDATANPSVATAVRPELARRLHAALEQCRRDRQHVTTWTTPDENHPLRTKLCASPVPQLGPKAVLLSFEEETCGEGVVDCPAGALAVSGEVHGANAELRAARQELRSARAELESMHRELARLHAPSAEVGTLERGEADLWSFFSSTQIAALVLDEDLRIQRFTPAAAELLGIGGADRGRRADDIGSELLESGLAEEARGVLSQLTPSMRELRTQAGRWVARRVLPYRTEARVIEGTVVSLVDVSELKGHAESLAERERRQAVIARLGLKALEEQNLQKFMEQAVGEVQQVLDADSVGLLELQPGGRHLLLRAGTGWESGLVGHITVGVELDSQAGFTLRSHAPVLVEDMEIESRFSGSSTLIRLGLRSGVSCPIWDRDGGYGVLGAHSRRPHAYVQDDGAFLQGVSAVISAAIKRHLARQRLALEVAVARSLSEARSFESGVRAMQNAFASEVGTEVGELWWADASRSRLERTVLFAEAPRDEQKVAGVLRGRAFASGEGMVGRVYESRRAEWVTSSSDETRFPRLNEVRSLGLASGFAFPVQAGNECLGVVTVFSRKRLIAERPLLRALEGIGRSIGEFARRIETEGRLRENEARKAVILDTSLDAVITMDAAGTVIDFNEAAERLFGYGKEEARGRPMAQLIVPPEQRERYQNRLRFYGAGPEDGSLIGQRVEMMAMHQDGSEFPVEVAVTQVSDAGELVFTGFIRDLREQKRAEQALRRSEARFREIFENVGASVWEADLTAAREALREAAGETHVLRYLEEHPEVVRKAMGLIELIDVNQETLRMLDVSSIDELLEALPSIVLPETEHACAGAFAALLEGKEFFTSETPAKTLRGERIECAFTARFPESSRFDRVLVSTMDITPLKRTQAQLAESQRWLNRLTEATPDAVCVYDAMADCIVYSSPRLDQVLGYTPDEILAIRSGLVDLFVHAQDRAAVRQFLATVTASEDSRVRELTRRMLHRDGTYRWIQSRAVPFNASPDRSQRHALIVLRDVSALKRAEEELQEASRQKDEFMAMLGHELRNPLSAVTGAAEQLKLVGGGDPRIARTQAILERQARHMGRLLDGLLDVSRVVLGKIEIERVPVDLASVVRNVAHDRQHAAATGAPRIELDLEGEVLWVHGDAVRLTQVVDNLLSNAVQHTPADGTIQIQLRADEENAILSVSDDGAGIDTELMPYIFEPFRQAQQSLDRAKGGLGLGLALVKSLSELHGGSVEAHSAGLGCGARFVVRLPLTQARPARASGEAAPGAQRILIVEDDEDVAAMLRDVLELKGHSVITAGCGPDALRVARDEKPAVVLCDLGLPGGMSGFDVAREMRSDPVLCDTHLIALSGYGRLQDRMRAEESGFDSHMTKPVDIPALARTVASPRPRPAP